MPRVSKGTRSNRKLKPDGIPDKFQPGFVGELDGRTLLARALRQRYEAIASDLGGEPELSTLKSSLLERAIWLEAMLVKIESDLAASQDPKLIASWIQAVNSYMGICKTLGLERSAHRNIWATLDAERQAIPPAVTAPDQPHERMEPAPMNG